MKKKITWKKAVEGIKPDMWICIDKVLKRMKIKKGYCLLCASKE